MNVRVVHHTYPVHHPLNTCAQPGAQNFRILVSEAHGWKKSFSFWDRGPKTLKFSASFALFQVEYLVM